MAGEPITQTAVAGLRNGARRKPDPIDQSSFAQPDILSAQAAAVDKTLKRAWSSCSALPARIYYLEAMPSEATGRISSMTALMARATPS